MEFHTFPLLLFSALLFSPEKPHQDMVLDARVNAYNSALYICHI